MSAAEGLNLGRVHGSLVAADRIIADHNSSSLGLLLVIIIARKSWTGLVTPCLVDVLA